MRPSYSLDELLPHRPPMRLIDEIEDFDVDSRTLSALFSARPEWSGNWAAIEYMAQAAAALAGAFDRLSGDDNPARPGFLLGTRRLALHAPGFVVGARYRARACLVYSDEEAASFDCSIEDCEGLSVAEAVLNAYRPSDMQNFMRTQGL